ncbi:MAG: SUMF1/EgtB/PvdO family nonheme iron enzyme [Tissierellales bacterium]|jgi:hypothetical protein|nr:SUMF1/EgtB/PvdO family nonheme iron enzyme [Tissierellales bacterium]
MKKIFISHASKDREFVDLLVELFCEILKLSEEEDFFYTSDNTSLKTGDNIVKKIEENLNLSEVVVIIITGNYFNSKYCITEMGASSILEKQTFPLFLPVNSIEKYISGTPFISTKARPISSTRDMKAVMSELATIFGISMNEKFYKKVTTYCDDFTSKINEMIRVKNLRLHEEMNDALNQMKYDLMKTNEFNVAREYFETEVARLSSELTYKRITDERDNNPLIWDDINKLIDTYGKLNDHNDILYQYHPVIKLYKDTAEKVLKLDEHVSDRKKYSAKRLMQICSPNLDYASRLEIGSELAIDDPRIGVSLTDSGLPDIDWVEIPEGDFLFSSMKKRKSLPSFWISRYPVTRNQFRTFVLSEEYKSEHFWMLGKKDNHIREFEEFAISLDESLNYPMVDVSWYEAKAFCKWFEGKTDLIIDLPSSKQWEKAARGEFGREFSYGDEFDEMKGHVNQPNYGACAVGLFPLGSSKYGVLDMSGNVWNWTSTIEIHTKFVELAGGSFKYQSDYAKTHSRGKVKKDHTCQEGGFRIITTVNPFNER